MAYSSSLGRKVSLIISKVCQFAKYERQSVQLRMQDFQYGGFLGLHDISMRGKDGRRQTGESGIWILEFQSVAPALKLVNLLTKP